MNSTSLIGLDEPDEWEKFSYDLSNTKHAWESHLVIDSMHCAACAINVEKALKSVQGVVKAEVNATSKRARVTWLAEVTKPSIWMEALVKAGYPALPANEIFQLDGRKKNKRLMLWRLLVAGFCMMQVMMYAYPSYIAHTGEMTSVIRNLLRWASWILTLPVIFFSSSPFFSNAINDIKNKQISMDLPVALGIVITFIVSTAATFQPDGWWGHETYFDSLTMFVFFLLSGRWLELRMRDKTAGSLDVLMRRIPSSITRVNVDGVEQISINRVKVGDVLRILPGEAFPADGVVLKGEGAADEALLTGESKPVSKMVGSEVIAGSHNLTTPIDMRVDKLGNSTRYAQIVSLMQQASIEKPRLALLADRIARPFLFFVIFASVIAASLLWSKDHGEALMAAVAVLIVTCPCALSLATPAAMLTVSGALARNGVLVRKMQALETLATVDVLLFDKTGTLTEGNMLVTNIHTNEDLTADQALQFAAAIAMNSLHPVSKALVTASEARNLGLIEVYGVMETPGAGLEAISTLGKLKLGSAQFCNLKQTNIIATSVVHLVSDQGWMASFEFEEAIKKEVASTIDKLKRLGVNVQMLSGDHQDVVNKLAKEIGIQAARGNCSPQDKLTHMQNLQKLNHKVAMIGDGLNDGPVLALAHVSIAMGQGVPLAQAQADFIMMNNQISSVVTLITEARRTMRIIKQNLSWAFIYNLICVPIAILGMLPAWLAGLGMALSSLLVIGNAFRLSKIQIEKP
ncbi:MAG: heavy metal translocating P-type ATPase [Methylophilus sp.]